MKKLFKIGLLLLILGGIGLYFALRLGSKEQIHFFEAVLSGNPSELKAMFHPALREEVDDPVLELWMIEVREKLGMLQSVGLKNFQTESHLDISSGKRITTTENDINFEKGSAHSKLEFWDSQLTAFEVKSELIPEDWFHGPKSTELYRKKAQLFFEALFRSDTSPAFQMMDEALKKEMPFEKLTDLTSSLVERAGALRSVEFQKESLTETNGVSLMIVDKLSTERGVLDGTVTFQFIGLKGCLIAFHIKGTPSAENQAAQSSEDTQESFKH